MTRHLFTHSALTAKGALRAAALGATAALVWAAASTAQAEEPQRRFNIEAQPLSDALLDYARQSDRVITVPPALVEGRMAEAVSGDMPPEEALRRLLADTGLSTERSASGAYRVRAADDGDNEPEEENTDQEPAEDGRDAREVALETLRYFLNVGLDQKRDVVTAIPERRKLDT